MLGYEFEPCVYHSDRDNPIEMSNQEIVMLRLSNGLPKVALLFLATFSIYSVFQLQRRGQ